MFWEVYVDLLVIIIQRLPLAMYDEAEHVRTRGGGGGGGIGRVQTPYLRSEKRV